jgi:hypothetical protein
MSSELTMTDYINILKYYKLSIPRSKKMIQNKAEKILNEKLCKCIKKIDPKDESKSIAICTKSLFTKKGYKRGKFTCLGKRTMNITKNKKKDKKKTIKRRQ